MPRARLQVLPDRDDVDIVIARSLMMSMTSSFVSPRPAMIPDFVSTG